MDYIQRANSGVQQLRPYQPGKPIEALQRELGLRDVVKLASNENPLGPSHRAQEAARRSLDQIHLYPDGAGFELKHALAENLGVGADRITLGNGSNDVIELVARAYLQPGDEAVFSEYAFAIYPLVTLGCSAKPVSVDSHLYGHDLAAIADAITERTRVVFLANPNNPTGRHFSPAQLLAWHARLAQRGGWLIVDEAYIDTLPAQSLAAYSAEPGLIVLRSFGKFFGMAGIRLGFVLAEQALLDRLDGLLGPWTISGPARFVTSRLLQDQPAQVRQRERLLVDGERLATLLRGHGLPPTGGCALFQWIASERAKLLHDFLACNGILTRLFAQPPSLRFGLPADEAGWQRLDQALAMFARECP